MKSLNPLNAQQRPLDEYRLLAKELMAVPTEHRAQIDRDLSLIVTGMKMQAKIQVGQPLTPHPSP